MDRHHIARRITIGLSGLLGIAGVALAAAASHGGDAHLLGNASMMCLVHAPALLAIAALSERLRTAPLAGPLLGLSTALFAADLVNRHVNGAGLFPMAAPIGGVAMMIAWALVAGGAFFTAGRD